MIPKTLRLAPALAAVVFGILMVTPLLGRGDDAATALAEYSRYLPGSPLPGDLDCDEISGYYDDIQVLCRADGGRYCEHGYVVARDDIITHASFFRCDFPVAYLTAQYGRYNDVRPYRRVIVLRWENAYAHVRRNGWLNAMESVSIVTWWKEYDPGSRDSR